MIVFGVPVLNHLDWVPIRISIVENDSHRRKTIEHTIFVMKYHGLLSQKVPAKPSYGSCRRKANERRDRAYAVWFYSCFSFPYISPQPCNAHALHSK